MIKRQRLLHVILMAVLLLALCGMVSVTAATWWGPQPQVNWNAWLSGQEAAFVLPGWLPQPQVNWNAWLSGQEVAFVLPGWLPQPQVNWNS